MTEEVKDAQAADATEASGPPAPVVPSASSPAEGSAQKGPDVSAIVEEATKRVKEELNAVLDERVDARFKSANDRRFAKVEEIYRWVQEAGGDVNKIKSNLEISDLREQISNLQSGGKSAVATAAQPDSDWTVAQAKTDIILRSAGIPSDDAEYNNLVTQYQGRVKPQDWPEIVEMFSKTRRGGSPASVVAEAGRSAPVSADADSISQRLVAATQTGAPTSEIAKLQEELEAALKS
jgi:hypothetical protein